MELFIIRDLVLNEGDLVKEFVKTLSVEKQYQREMVSVPSLTQKESIVTVTAYCLLMVVSMS